MKPIVINITSLIGTMVIIGDKKEASKYIEETVLNTLLKVVSKAQNVETQELCPDKTVSPLPNPEKQD
jgi:hypothetical protein